MFSYFGNQNKNLAFRTDSHDFGRDAAARHLSAVLYAFIDGQEKAYAVRYAMREIEALFGESAALSLSLIRQMMALDADAYNERLRLITEAVQLIERQMRGDHS